MRIVAALALLAIPLVWTNTGYAAPGDDAPGVPVMAGPQPATGTQPSTGGQPATGSQTAAACTLATNPVELATDECKKQEAAPSLTQWNQCLKGHKDTLADPEWVKNEQAAAVAFDQAAKDSRAACEVVATKTKAVADATTDLAQKKAKVTELEQAKKEGDAAKQALDAAKQDVKAAQAAVEQAEKDLTTATSDRDAKDAARTDALAQLNAVRPKGSIEARVKELQEQIALLEKATSLETQIEAADCKRAEIMCFDHVGLPVVGEALPREVVGGDTVTVKLLVTTEQLKAEKIAVVFSSRKSLDVKFDGNSKSDAERAATTGFDADNAADAIHTIPHVSDPVDGDAEAFAVTVTTKKGDVNIAQRRYEFDVPQGYSYYSVALMVAATPGGERTLRADLSVHEDTAVDTAIALNIFPGGRPRGVIGYLRKVKSCRDFFRQFGFTIATDVDLSDPLDRLYAGIVFEPVAGIAFTSGVSLRKVATVPPGAALPDVTMDGDIPTAETSRAWRGYIGVTMTLDLLDTLAEFRKSVTKLSP